MRIRVGSKSNGNSVVGIFVGIFMILFGLSFALPSLCMGNMSSMVDKILPDGVEPYDAYVIEVVKVEEDEKLEEDMDGYSYVEIVYDCDVVLQYEVNGQTYSTKYTFNDESDETTIGDKCEVYIHPDNPEKIYGYGKSSGDDVGFVFTLVFGFIGGTVTLIGVIVLVVTIKKRRAVNVQRVNSMANDNMSYDNQIYGGQSYNQPYNQPYSQPYNQVNTQNYDMNNTYGTQVSKGTDYSGTSLRD